ncbi:ABC transporter ATP-binding protein [Enterococcus faecium]|nr:ABC transporter ATP-binding protein [Enterococcus faecium]
MKAILGLIHYSEGTIRIGENEISPSSHKGLEQVGALIEYPGIYPFLTGYDHLKLFSETNDVSAIDTIVKQLKMEKYIHKKAKSYSLGMKQKLGIALALLNHPSIVILDEPMNGLDPQATRDVRKTITDLATQGTSFLISSHLLSELEKMVDELILINQGKIIKQCTMAELNQTAQDFIVISTTNDQAARTILTDAGYPLEDPDKIKLLKKNEELLGTVIQLLSAENVHVTDVQHLTNDLESSLLEILDSVKGEEEK